MWKTKSILLIALSCAGYVKSAALTNAWKEGDFEELYTSSLNLTRYPSANTPASMQFDQNQKRWTWYNPAYVQTNVALPNYPTAGAKGMKARLSQAYCTENATNCCSGSKCAKWAGAHLETQSCFQFGKFEWEASLILNTDNAARIFFGLYVNGASNMDNDTAWNEIDVAYGAGAGKTPFFSGAYFIPHEYPATWDSTTTPSYDGAMAAAWNNYTLIWTPTSLTYLINGVQYWNQVNNGAQIVPWRCMSYRFIVRTDEGSSTPASDDFVYLKRFQYQTLDTYMNSPSLNNPQSGATSSFSHISFSISLALITYILFFIA